MRAVRVFASFRFRSVVFWGFVPLLLLCGCGRIRIKLGTRTALDKLPVNAIEVSLPVDPAVAPGEKSPLLITFTDSAGKTWVTEGVGRGRIEWRDIAVTSTVVTVSKKGVVSLPRDPRLTDGQTGHVVVTVPSHPSLRAELDVPLHYDYAYKAAYSGSSGTNGFNGTDGTNGSDGSTGSFDPDHPSPGGNGTDGTNGGDGSDGHDGSDGPDLHVGVTLRPGAHPMLQVGIAAPGHSERFYLVDPQGGSLTISSDGGSGGSGGKGGRGGHGGSGGPGSPSGSSGRDGSNGSDGRSGSSGRPGRITVTYDPQAKPYISVIQTSRSAKVTFIEQPVAPLW